jgi:hypothetical protein
MFHHLADMFEIFGKMPTYYSLELMNSEEFFDQRGRVIGRKKLNYTSVKEMLKDETSNKFTEDELNEISEFINDCCKYIPKQRPNVDELLHSNFVKFYK